MTIKKINTIIKITIISLKDDVETYLEERMYENEFDEKHVWNIRKFNHTDIIANLLVSSISLDENKLLTD